MSGPNHKPVAWGGSRGASGGGNDASSRVGDGVKRQPNGAERGGSSMVARKQHSAGGQRAGKPDSYQEEVYTTKLDISKLTEEQIRKAERLAKEIEGNSKNKNNRKLGEYEDRDDDEVPPQPAPPPPANNAATFPALGGGGNAPAAPEPVKPQSAQPPQQSAPVDPAVLQMGPYASTNSTAPAQADAAPVGRKGQEAPPMAGGVPMNGPMQFPPGMQGRMMPAMAPPQMMQPGQGGMPAGWQGGSMNNQPPNNAGVVAGSEGPADPMLMQQWQAHQAQAQQQQMMQHMMQMRITLEYLQQENKKLTAEKSQSFKMSDPNKDIRELEQKKETLGKEVMQLMAQKNQLEFMCNQLTFQQHHMQAMMMDKAPPLPGTPDYAMGMGPVQTYPGMPINPMILQQHPHMQQQMMMQQMYMQQMQGGPQIQPPMQGQPHLPPAQPMPMQQQPPPQVQQQQSSGAPPPQAPANPTPPADAQQANPTPAAAPNKPAPPPQNSASPAEQLAASGPANASPAPPNSSTAALQAAATAAPVPHANGGPDASSWQPQQAQAPQIAQPAAPQARAKVSAGDAETMQNLKRQLLHLKKTTDHREYFDLDNMTMQQLESTIKRVQEANGIPTKKDAGEKARGRANNEVAAPGLRSDDGWEVVAPTKKGSTALVRTDKQILTPTHADRNGMTTNILNGFVLFTEFLTANEESQLVNFVNDQVAKGARRELAGNTYYKAKHMTAQLHYGVFYNIAENSLGGKAVEPIPKELNDLINKLTTEGILKQQQRPNTALVSVMEEGDGMLPHVDSKEFARPICTLSLLADNEMLFGDKSGQIEAHGIGNMDGHARTIPRRSVVRMEDLVANDVQHAINPSKTRRIIITFRHQIARSRSQGMGR